MAPVWLCLAAHANIAIWAVAHLEAHWLVVDHGVQRNLNSLDQGAFRRNGNVKVFDEVLREQAFVIHCGVCCAICCGVKRVDNFLVCHLIFHFLNKRAAATPYTQTTGSDMITQPHQRYYFMIVLARQSDSNVSRSAACAAQVNSADLTLNILRLCCGSSDRKNRTTPSGTQ